MVRLAHARCTQPKIVEFDADAPPGTRPEEAGRICAMTLVLSYPEGPRSVRYAARAPGGSGEADPGRGEDQRDHGGHA
jgi:hypothetical protein